MNIGIELNNLHIAESAYKDIDVYSYTDLVRIINDFTIKLNGDKRFNIRLYAESKDFDIMKLYKGVDLYIENAISWAEEWRRTLNRFGRPILDDFESFEKARREIYDPFIQYKQFNIGDIVYCDSDSNFHIVIGNDDLITLSDFASELIPMYDVVPSYYIHKVPEYMIKQLDLGILHEFNEFVSKDAPNYNYDYDELENKYKPTHPWLKI